MESVADLANGLLSREHIGTSSGLVSFTATPPTPVTAASHPGDTPTHDALSSGGSRRLHDSAADFPVSTHFCSSCKKRIPFEAFQRRQNGSLYNTCTACLTRTKQRKSHGQQRAAGQRATPPGTAESMTSVAATSQGSGNIAEGAQQNTRAADDARHQQSPSTTAAAAAAATSSSSSATAVAAIAASLTGNTDDTMRSVLEAGDAAYASRTAAAATARRIISSGFPYGTVSDDLDRITSYDAATSLLSTIPQSIPLIAAPLHQPSSHPTVFPSGSQSPVRQPIPSAISASSSVVLPMQPAAGNASLGSHRRGLGAADQTESAAAKRRRLEAAPPRPTGLSIDCMGAAGRRQSADHAHISAPPISPVSAGLVIPDAYVQLEYQRLELERQRLALDQERWREERAERLRWEQMCREQWQEEREQRKAFREREQHIWRILLSLRSLSETSL
ncbi:hypothetical protein LPJ56_000352 [Coemansia sp. RSA 2599]|nr:hypothetical protein LPJ56_000352 [Coemansia sp. RSA 2599]